MKDKNNRPKSNWLKAAVFSAAALVSCAASAQQVGELLWQDNFDTLNPDIWSSEDGDGCGIGICGWGNQELEWYSSNNVHAQDGKLVIEARREDQNAGAHNGKVFTSARLNTQHKLSVQYGMIEVRMSQPQVGIGLWPAAWMLGTNPQAWPRNGEIDMMESGHRAQAMADAGFPNADVNSFVGSNAIFYSADACVEGNPTCAASTAYQTDNAYVSPTPLSNRFVIYRTYWTDSEIRFTIEENGVETDLYDKPITIGDGMDEFQKPFYLLLDLAIGGNFTDAPSNGAVTAPLPAQMQVDYIRIYKLDGEGKVWLGDPPPPPAETGTFGVFTDNTPTSNKLEAGIDSDIYIWNTDSVSEGSEAPYEGDNVIAWHYNAPGQWFGGGVLSRGVVNLSNFNDGGKLKFRIKIPADVAFKVGVADAYTNENWITFAAGESKYGLTRDGQWGEVSIPVDDLRGQLIAMQALTGVFYIASVDGALPTHSFQMAVDDVRYVGGGSAGDSDGDGVADNLDQCPDTAGGVTVDESGCEVVDPNPSITPETLKIEAEDYARFNDTTAGNTGGAYRSDDVDIEVSSDNGGGYDVGWLASGEWLEYDVNVKGGTYRFNTRVANGSASAADYTLLVDGNSVSSDNVPVTGGWQSFVTHKLDSVSLTPGSHVIRLNFNDGEFNINWLSLSNDSDSDGVVNDNDNCPNTPVGIAVDAQGCEQASATDDVTVEAEDYKNYFDTTAGNDGGAYRSDDVDIEATTDTGGGYDVGWTDTNEWLEYDVELSPGTYTLTARVASNVSTGSYTVSLDGNPVGSSSVSATGGWQSFTTQSLGSVDITSAGVHSLRIDINAPGANINWFNFSSATACQSASCTDSDNDGVTDDIDACANTPAGTSVDSDGCALAVDSDGDGVNDGADACPNTPAGTSVGGDGCAQNNSGDSYGVTQTGAGEVVFFVNTSDWADVHYSVNGGGQVNVSMAQAGGKNTYTVTGLASGDTLSYFFTYYDASVGGAVDSASQSYTLGQ